MCWDGLCNDKRRRGRGTGRDWDDEGDFNRIRRGIDGAGGGGSVREDFNCEGEAVGIVKKVAGDGETQRRERVGEMVIEGDGVGGVLGGD